MKNDGGRAFPVHVMWHDHNGDEHTETHEGMSLRDYFAAKAMQSLCTFSGCADRVPELAIQAYAFADAMLAERGK